MYSTHLSDMTTPGDRFTLSGEHRHVCYELVQAPEELEGGILRVALLYIDLRGEPVGSVCTAELPSSYSIHAVRRVRRFRVRCYLCRKKIRHVADTAQWHGFQPTWADCGGHPNAITAPTQDWKHAVWIVGPGPQRQLASCSDALSAIRAAHELARGQDKNAELRAMTTLDLDGNPLSIPATLTYGEDPTALGEQALKRAGMRNDDLPNLVVLPTN